jgi:hypothetical protein
MSEATAETLLELKGRIETATADVSRFEGQLGEILRQLEKDHGVKDETKAAKKLKQLRVDAEKMEEELEEMVAELESEMEEMEQ